jgi:hypothetical protein
MNDFANVIRNTRRLHRWQNTLSLRTATRRQKKVMSILNFTQLVYGDSNQHGNILKKHLTPGSYVFFNTRIGNSRYISSYFYVEKLWEKEKDSEEIKGLHCSA